MKILMIGGTGTISSAITRQLAQSNHELWLLNRGSRKNEVPNNVKQIIADIDDEKEVLRQIGDTQFDAVCEFIGFLPSQVERDIRLFKGHTKQYVYISSASAYNKPAASHVITEGTTLANPYWEYSRNKIACEELLLKEYRENGFPITIIRPSHTYCKRAVPVSVHGLKGSWQVLKRMMEGKPVLVHGDGSSLWTLTWNEDFAQGFIGLLGNPKAIGEAFQIMSDESLTSGLNPRTAIGQRSDGAILMLVVDGRRATSLGASFKDEAEQMLAFGAVNATNLDGGSSSLMWMKGEYLNNKAAVIGVREIPTSFLVMP